ncbi:MAG: cytidylate kinase family protein [Muribaculaceae bacterium]|nr:cytidylate kinase family protein [Muribaculaceae bacterium]
MRKTANRTRKEKLRRYLVFWIGLFIMSFGVSLVTRSLLGTSPISSAPYVWSIHTALSMGTYIIILNVILITAQLIMLGKDGIKENRVDLLMQIPVSLLFGVFVDVTMSVLSWWHPDHYVVQVLSCIAGCCIMALGISLEVVADVCMNSGEYVLQIASKKFKREFGTLKIMFDVSLLLIAVGCSWIFSGRIEGVREGTVIVAVLTGPVVRFILPHLGWLKRWESENTPLTKEKEDKNREKPDFKVITIGREYGSGGHEIGEKVAKALGIPFYDNSMMEMVARESGIDITTVKEYDQRLPHSLLYELVTQELNVTPDRALSKKNALFVAQSRVIRHLASQGACVIVGRCADYVLGDRSDIINIFLRASEEYKVKRAVTYYGIEKERAEEKVRRTNSMRRAHYSYFTENSWGDPKNYDAVFDTSRLSQNVIVRAIVNLYGGVS